MESHENNIINNNKILRKENNKSFFPIIKRENNIRFIEPYEFDYQVYAKGRWVGKRLIDILTHEFSRFNEDYYLNSIKDEKLKINNKPTFPNYIICRNDLITQKVIRKENPIIDSKIDIIFENEDFIVVDKPSSWPVHDCGGYLYNTLHRILSDEYNYENLKSLHRLDKPTSGIVIFARNKEMAEYFRQKLNSDNDNDNEVESQGNSHGSNGVHKVYLCRVKGEVLWENKNVIRGIINVNKAKGIYTDVDFDLNLLKKDKI
jgi:23S rRNA-/tRNA-specific pseudouridylate synthase